jgi:hypothetical protein
MARVRVRRNFTFTDALRDEMPTEAAMRLEGQQIAADIKRRTASRLDEDGKPFTPKADGTPATLGGLLDDLAVTEVTRNRVRVGFRTEDAEELGRFHQEGTRRMPARPFLGLSARQIDGVVRRLFRRRQRP